MQTNDLLKYRDKIIEAFKDGNFSSEHLKKSDAATYGYVLESVEKFIRKIKSMAENINLSLFNEFFESPSPANHAKELINTRNPDENKEIVTNIKNMILDLKDRIKERSEKEKECVDKTLRIFEEILDYNKGAQKTFSIASKVDKGKSEPKPEESIAERVKLRIQKSEEKEFNNFLEQIKKEQKNIDIAWFKNEFNYETPDKILEYLNGLSEMIIIIKQHFLLKIILKNLVIWLEIC